jgi:putative salt-induced outer membrane protein YdiY
MRRNVQLKLKAITLATTLLLIPLEAYAKRNTDVVVMRNGDRLTGEIKKLENGILYVETDYFSGSIGLDWLQVERVQSTGNYQITLKDGSRVEGTITRAKSSPEGADFVIHGDSGDRWAASSDIVEIYPQKRSFWSQVTGDVNLGYSFTSGNKQTSFNFGTNANYVSTKYFGSASFTSNFSGQSGGNQTNLAEVQTLDGVFITRNSIVIGLANLLHSSQQDLQLRTTLGGGYGYYFIHTNHQNLLWTTGAAYTNEQFESTEGATAQSAEAFLGLQYLLFHFDRYNLNAQTLFYPGLTDAPRFRVTTKFGFSVKIAGRFHTDVQFWNNFDSHPPFNTKRNELGISNSLGWTF